MKPPPAPIARWEQCIQRLHPTWSQQRLDSNMLRVTTRSPDEELSLLCGVDEAWYAAEYAFAFVAPEYRRAAVGELLHMVNDREFPGCVFNPNYSTGSITCRSAHLSSNGVPDDSWLDQGILKPVLEAVARYRTGLIATSYYDVAPNVALPLSAMDLVLIPPSDPPDAWWI